MSQGIFEPISCISVGEFVTYVDYNRGYLLITYVINLFLLTAGAIV